MDCCGGCIAAAAALPPLLLCRCRRCCSAAAAAAALPPPPPLPPLPPLLPLLLLLLHLCISVMHLLASTFESGPSKATNLSDPRLVPIFTSTFVTLFRPIPLQVRSRVSGGPGGPGLPPARCAHTRQVRHLPKMLSFLM